jgi:ABC-type uncharacterized transport system substrate-binding protein
MTDIEHELISTQWDLKVAKDRIKRLEEAGDAMVETTTTPAAEAWRKAKEDKP